MHNGVMNPFQRPSPRLGGNFANALGSTPSWLTGPLGRSVGLAAGAVVLVGAVFFSAIVLSVLLVGGVLVGGVIWWRTRDLRRQLRGEIERMQAAFERAGGPGADPAAPEARPRGGSARSPSSDENMVIDGDFVRDVDTQETRRG